MAFTLGLCLSVAAWAGSSTYRLNPVKEHRYSSELVELLNGLSGESVVSIRAKSEWKKRFKGVQAPIYLEDGLIEFQSPLNRDKGYVVTAEITLDDQERSTFLESTSMGERECEILKSLVGALSTNKISLQANCKAQGLSRKGTKQSTMSVKVLYLGR